MSKADAAIDSGFALRSRGRVDRVVYEKPAAEQF
jgi:hypothetical protein